MHCQFKNRNRKENDFELSKEKIFSTVANFQKEIDNILNKVAVLAEQTAYVHEICQIQVALNLQEEVDRQQIGLYGATSGPNADLEKLADFGTFANKKTTAALGPEVGG